MWPSRSRAEYMRTPSSVSAGPHNLGSCGLRPLAVGIRILDGHVDAHLVGQLVHRSTEQRPGTQRSQIDLKPMPNAGLLGDERAASHTDDETGVTAVVEYRRLLKADGRRDLPTRDSPPRHPLRLGHGAGGAERAPLRTSVSVRFASCRWGRSSGHGLLCPTRAG